MQVADSRAEDSLESGSSKEKELGSRSSSFTGSEGDAVKPSDGKGSDEDKSVAHIPGKRQGVKKSDKKRAVGTADSVSIDDAELQNGTRSLKEVSEDGQNKTELALNSEKENAEESEEEPSGEERLLEASKRSQKVEELTKTAKPRGRPPKNRVNLQSEETGEAKLPKIAKPRGRPPKAKDHHSSDEDTESKVEEQEEIVEGKSGSEKGDTGEAEILSHEKTANSGSVEDFRPLASPRRGRPPKTGSGEKTAKVARPRGRPPKPRDSQSGSEGEPAQSARGGAPKRTSRSTARSKRGRPPKVRLVESDTEEGGAVVHARPRGRPPKGAQEGGAIMSPKRGRLPKPKAKRGRPSKVSLLQSGIASPSSGRSPKAKRKRGRPSNASLGLVSTASPARARGRPMKQPRPRGRPPKVPPTSSGINRNWPATPRSGPQLKAKGKRGRPSKVLSADSDTEAQITKSPRGRPRKIKLTESGTAESSEMEDPEVTASSDGESSPAEREDQSRSESGMKEEVEPELIAGPRRGRPPKAGKGITDEETGQIKSTKTKGQPPKRKSVGTTGRGRPPKVRVTESGIEGEIEVETEEEPNNRVPPRRGRPPKVKPSEGSMEEDGDEPAISISPRRGRPPKAKQPRVNPDAHDREQGAAVGLKRGRPPKAKAVEVSAEEQAWGEDKDQMCASPGTGSLQTDEENAVASEPSDREESEEKEGVTIEVTGAESISDSVEDEEEGKMKATGRGRPPKVKGFKSGSEQKKRGRPPKAKGPEQA